MQSEIHSPTKLDVLVEHSLLNIRKRYDNQDTLSGLPTGFQDLDAMTWGLQLGTLTIIGARSAMGKTALALTICRNIALACDLAVCMVSNEDSKEQVAERLLIMGSQINADRLRTRQMNDSDWNRLSAESERLKHAPIIIDDCSLTVPQIHEKCRSLVDSGVNLQLLVVDRIQQIGLDDTALASGENNLSVARRLKRMASELNIAIIALSQVARAVEYRKNKRPMLSDLRANGVDDDAADLVIFLYRDEYYYSVTPQRGEAELIIAKHRHGPLGTVELLWKSGIGTFENKAIDCSTQLDSNRSANDTNHGKPAVCDDVRFESSECSEISYEDIIKREGCRVAGFVSALGLGEGMTGLEEKYYSGIPLSNIYKVFIDFLSSVLKREVTTEESHAILFEACERLRQKHPDLTLKAMKIRIWKYQVNLKDD